MFCEKEIWFINVAVFFLLTSDRLSRFFSLSWAERQRIIFVLVPHLQLDSLHSGRKAHRRKRDCREVSSPKRPLSKRQIAEMHTVEIHIIEIGVVEIKMAEDILSECMNNSLYNNRFFPRS